MNLSRSFVPRTRVVNGVLRGVLLGAAGGLWSSAYAQATPTAPEPRPFCFRGRPAPTCSTFLITEVGGYQRVVGSVTRYGQGGSVGGPPEFLSHDLGNQLTFEIGAMKNRTTNTAVGATVAASFGTGAALALKGRYRRWLSPQGIALDLGAGPILLGSAHSGDGPNTPGLTADVALNAHDFGAVVARVDVLRTNGKTASALYGGVRLGSQPAVVATGVLAIGLFIIVRSLDSSFQ